MIYKTIKELATFIDDGDWIESKDQSDNGIWLIQTGNIGCNELKLKENKKHYITESTFKRLNCKEVLNGDILVSRLPDPVGRSCIINGISEKCITAVDCTIIRINNNLIDKNYLINFMNSNNYYEIVNSNITGSTRKRISRKKLENINVPIYPLDQQKNIATELNKISKTITYYQKIIDNLNELLQIIFNEKFGNINDNPNNYECLTIKDVCSSIVRGPFGSALKKEFFVEKNNNTFKVYEQKNAIQNNSFIGEYYINKDKFEELKRFECKAGDIIMSCSGTVGKLSQLPLNCERGVINQALCKFTLNEKITPNYFISFINNIIDKLNSKGSSIKNISSVAYIKNIEILLPPISVQKEYENFTNYVGITISNIQMQISKLKELYDIKCNKYFGGAK